ncbi:hypothetical protein Tco_0038710 [Tanacetum coccineum]
MMAESMMKLFSEYGFKAKYHLEGNVIIAKIREKDVVCKIKMSSNERVSTYDVAWLWSNGVKRGGGGFHIVLKRSIRLKYLIHTEADAT